MSISTALIFANTRCGKHVRSSEMWMPSNLKVVVSNCQPIDVNGHVCTTFLFPVVHYKLFGLKSVKEQVHVSVQHNQVPHIPL